jgi:hypothetical protein
MQLPGERTRPRVRWLAPRQPQPAAHSLRNNQLSRTRKTNRRGRRLAARGGACAPRLLLQGASFKDATEAHLALLVLLSHLHVVN